MNEECIRLLPIGETFVNGLSNAYQDEYSDFPEMMDWMTKEEFDSAIFKINQALTDHWPCMTSFF